MQHGNASVPGHRRGGLPAGDGLHAPAQAGPGKAGHRLREGQEIIDYAYSHGVNYFDTAYVYHGGQSESFIGQALKKYPRESYFLATKMPIWCVKKQEDVERIFNEQLQKCQVDYFDFYLFHAQDAGNFKKCQEFGVYEFLSRMKAEGKIRRLGFSFHDTPEVLRHICDTYDWDFAQIQLNYLDWEMQDARTQYQILADRGIPVVVMEPVRGGALASPCDAANILFREERPDKSVASWAIRFVASLPGVLTVLSGMSDMEQVRDNVDTMTNFEPLTERDREIIDAALEAYRKKDTVPCTGCRYCMDCPFGVDIPKMFALYNHFVLDKDEEDYLEAYRAQPEETLADKCRACGACLSKCPQHIKIPEKMAAIRETVDKLSAK